MNSHSGRAKNACTVYPSLIPLMPIATQTVVSTAPWEMYSLHLVTILNVFIRESLLGIMYRSFITLILCINIIIY